jgi:hypothetical protein
VLEATRQVEERLPFALLGFDSDNGDFWERVRLARGVWRPAKHIPDRLLFELGRSEEESLESAKMWVARRAPPRAGHSRL